jgi:hypothetical protein
MVRIPTYVNRSGHPLVIRWSSADHPLIIRCAIQQLEQAEAAARAKRFYETACS